MLTLSFICFCIRTGKFEPPYADRTEISSRPPKSESSGRDPCFSADVEAARWIH